MRRHNGQPPNAACLFPPRRTEGLSNRIPFSFASPALVVLRLLFSVCSPSPQKARPLACPSGKIACSRREESWCAEERQKARRIPAFRRKDTFLPFAERKGIGGPLTNENLEGEGSDGDLPLGVILWESEDPKRIDTRDPRLDNIKDNATLLDLQAVFAARPFPLGTASPPGFPHRTRLRPGPSTVSGQHHDAGAGLAATSVLCLRPGPRFYAAPPYAAQHCSTFANPQTLYSCPGLKTTTAFRPSPPANALRLRRPVAVLRRRQSAAQLYAVVDLYTAIWFVTRMRRLTGADSAQHDLLTISRTWISASVSSEQWGHVSQWRRRRAAASRGI